MRRATISEVGRDFLGVLKWIEADEEVEVLSEGKLVALISPPLQRVQHPDYLARLKRSFGDKVISPEASAELRDLN